MPKDLIAYLLHKATLRPGTRVSLGEQTEGGRSLNYENGKGHLLGSEGNTLGKKEVGRRGAQGQQRDAREKTMRLQDQGEP